MEQRDLILTAQRGDTNAAEQLLQQNSGLIWSIVRRYYGRGVELEDLYQIGSIGMLKAIQSFDCDYGTQFSTYAVYKISGEIRRFLRDDGAVKVSRTVKSLAARVYTARQRFVSQYGHEPTLSELSALTDASPEEIAACEQAVLPVESLQRAVGEDGASLEQMIGDCGIEERILDRISLQETIQKLPELERKVILLRYYRSQTQQVCAAALGISQVQVSRLERRALERMRALLKETG